MKITETKRLSLHHLNSNDAPFIQTLYNTDAFLKNIGNKNLKTQNQTKKYLETGPINMYKTHGYGLWRIQRKIPTPSTPIGICGLLKRDWLEHPDLGFALLPRHEGKGYAFEAAKATLHWAQHHLDNKKILAITTPENHRSITLLERLGFSFLELSHEPDDTSKLKCFQFTM